MSGTAIVTGASAGIGEAFARTLAARGFDLVIVARDRSRLERLAAELRDAGAVQVDVVAADLTKREDLARVEDVVRHTPTLTLLVNNAGFGTKGPFADSDLEREDEEIRLNVLALVRLTRAALPGLIARRDGAIINVSSVQGFFPSPLVATYGATKAFVNSFTESIASEVEGKGIKIQALCPGFTRTEFQVRAGIKSGSIPSAVWMTPQAVAEASLAALDGGDLYCVPGVQYAALLGLEKVIPRAITRKITSALTRRFL
jgi:short-subunit dehydrogenase